VLLIIGDDSLFKEAKGTISIFETMATSSSSSSKVINIESADQYNNIISKQNQLVRISL
jgi:D-aminopeptidase